MRCFFYFFYNRAQIRNLNTRFGYRSVEHHTLLHEPFSDWDFGVQTDSVLNINDSGFGWILRTAGADLCY